MNNICTSCEPERALRIFFALNLYDVTENFFYKLDGYDYTVQKPTHVHETLKKYLNNQQSEIVQKKTQKRCMNIELSHPYALDRESLRFLKLSSKSLTTSVSKVVSNFKGPEMTMFVNAILETAPTKWSKKSFVVFIQILMQQLVLPGTSVTGPFEKRLPIGM